MLKDEVGLGTDELRLAKNSMTATTAERQRQSTINSLLSLITHCNWNSSCNCMYYHLLSLSGGRRLPQVARNIAD
jgi:hypothetical protein